MSSNGDSTVVGDAAAPPETALAAPLESVPGPDEPAAGVPEACAPLVGVPAPGGPTVRPPPDAGTVEAGVRPGPAPVASPAEALFEPLGAPDKSPLREVSVAAPVVWGLSVRAVVPDPDDDDGMSEGTPKLPADCVVAS